MSIIKKLCYGFLFTVFIAFLLLFFLYHNGYSEDYSQPIVMEDITFNPISGIYTYTYTIHNLLNSEIWWWGIWYKAKFPVILDDSTVDEEGFAYTDKDDCSPDWKNTAPDKRMGFCLYAGPQGEMGFFSTYAADATSQHPPNIGYMEGDVFHPLYSIDQVDAAKDQGKLPESDLEKPYIGAEWGWSGYNADILTAYGIQYGKTGTYVIRSTHFFPGNKYFFYNTTDYWNSYYDYTLDTQVIGGFESVAIAQISYNKLNVSINSSASSVTVQLAGSALTGYPIKQSMKAAVIDGQASLDFFVLDYGTYTVTASAKGYQSDQISNIVIDETYEEQNFTLNIKNWIPRIVIKRKDYYLANYFAMDLVNVDIDDNARDWPSGLTVELGFYAATDDLDQNGIPDLECLDCWNDPDGEFFYLETDLNTKGTLSFSLPVVVDEDMAIDYHMTDFVYNQEWGVAFSVRLFDSTDNCILGPTYYQFRVKKTQPMHPLIAETQTSFYSDRIPQEDISVEGRWVIDDEEEYPVVCAINLSAMDTHYLSRIDGGPLEFADTNQPLTVKLEVSKHDEDPNSIAMNIFFMDKNGNHVEYNPINLQTGFRDPAAPPITYAIPLHKSLQKLYERLQEEGNSSLEALSYIQDKVASHPDQDFMYLEGRWQPKLGKYGIYFITGNSTPELFHPTSGENIEIIVSNNGILMAKITARHTSQWYMKESVATVRISGDSMDVGCFIDAL
ncbi:MAG: carboxypeptidase-like regulatory domain-containing protein [bacterium]